jgi:hypothetical protein
MASLLSVGPVLFFVSVESDAGKAKQKNLTGAFGDSYASRSLYGDRRPCEGSSEVQKHGLVVDHEANVSVRAEVAAFIDQRLLIDGYTGQELFSREAIGTWKVSSPRCGPITTASVT